VVSRPARDAVAARLIARTRRPDRASRSGTNLAVDLLSARQFQTADPVNDSLAAAAEGGAA